MAHFDSRKNKRPHQGIAAPVLLFTCVIVLFAAGISSVGEGTLKRQKEALENALTRYITECYAEEGRYPESVYYLEDRYGLRFNEDRFYVDYRVRSGNVRPEFTVITRQEDE